LPGHGRSLDLRDADYVFESAAEACLALLDSRGLGRCHLVGYSLGGRLALYLALRAAERFNRVVLEAASPGLELEAERTSRQASDTAAASHLQEIGMGRFVEVWYRQPLFHSLRARPALHERVLEARQRNRADEIARALVGMSTGRQPSLWAELPNLALPSLAVAGAFDEKYSAVARRMQHLSPVLQAVIVQAAGHNVHLECPRVFAGLVRDFWEASGDAAQPERR